MSGPPLQRITNVLVGVELSPRGDEVPTGSRTAMEQAVWLARACGARLTVVHSTWMDPYAEPRHLDGIEGPEGGALQELVAGARAQGVECEPAVTAERPWLAIIRSVLRREADVVVVGKRDRSENVERKLGNVAVKLLRKCPSPVWLVKPAHDLVHKLVLAATDLSPVGDQAVACAAFVAERHACELQVVHAYRVPVEIRRRADDLGDDEYSEQVEVLRLQIQKAIETVVPQQTAAKPPKVHVLRNFPSGAIMETVEHLHPDLLVMGTISKGSVPGFYVGTTAERVLGRVDCSILALKPDDFLCPVTAG